MVDEDKVYYLTFFLINEIFSAPGQGLEIGDLQFANNDQPFGAGKWADLRKEDAPQSSAVDSIIHELCPFGLAGRSGRMPSLFYRN